MTLDEILSQHGIEPESQLALQLKAREDGMADLIRLAGAQFGLFGEIVAEVLAQVGLGTPPSAEERQLIHNNFVALMERLRHEFEQGT